MTWLFSRKPEAPVTPAPIVIPPDDPHRVVLEEEAKRRHSYVQEVTPAVMRLDEYKTRLNSVVQRAGIKLRRQNVSGMEDQSNGADSADNHHT